MALADVEIIQIGARSIGISFRIRGVDLDHLLGRADRQRPQQQRIDETENGTVGADTESQREDRCGREARTLRRGTEGVAYILNDVLKVIAHTFSSCQRLDSVAEIVPPELPKCTTILTTGTFTL